MKKNEQKDNVLKRDMNFIYNRHDVVVNQFYSDNLPYSFHLKMVVAVGERFKHLIPNDVWKKVKRALAGHDLIEDARLTYNDVKNLFGELVADIIYACTDLRGHTRDERHGPEFIETLQKNRLGVFVKICDMIANSTYSRVMGSSMFEKYKRDLPKFKEQLYVPGEYDELWTELELILN
jgi:(p)ppGpp synthase/HD superfamily hydrolase